MWCHHLEKNSMSVNSILRTLVRAKRYRYTFNNKKRVSLTLNQLTILFILEDLRQNGGEELYLTKIAAEMDSSIGTVSAAVISLEKQNLVKRRIKRTHQRGRQLTIPEIRAQGIKIVASFMA
jgi:DNA-binding MarR family transcriptional regulator